MEIRTILINAGQAERFDKLVNEALAEGFHIVKRELLPFVEGPSRYVDRAYYAELVKLDPPPAPKPWEEAVKTLHDTCETAGGCGEACPMFAWCEKNLPGDSIPPNYWDLPAGPADD